MNVKPDIDIIRLKTFLPYQISLLADKIGRRTAAVAKRHDGLNLSHWRVLAAVAESPGRTANEVVAITPMDKGIVSRAVKSLIEMNLLTRKASKDDGRISHLFLTAKGMRQYASMAKEIRAFEQKLRSLLTEKEGKDFERLLPKLIEAAQDDSAN